jgi:hypothetical protein
MPMDLKPGSRWKSAVCDGEFVVVRPPKSPVSLECGGHQVIAHAETRAGDLVLSDAHGGGSAAGKRYADPETGLEVLCSKAGAGSLSIDGRPIGATEAKKLPSSD